MAVILKKIDETMVELKRFYSALKAAKCNLQEKKKMEMKRREMGLSSGYAYPVSTTCSPKESGAAMRASMDLSRKLAEFRRS